MGIKLFEEDKPKFFKGYKPRDYFNTKVCANHNYAYVQKGVKGVQFQCTKCGKIEWT